MQHLDLLAGVLEAMVDAVIVVDSSGTVLYANGELEQLSGYGRHELVGQSVEVLVPGHARGRHERSRDEYLGAAARRPMGPRLDVRLRRRDGAEVPVDVVLSPLATPDGARVLAVVRAVPAARQGLVSLRERGRMLVDERQRIAGELHDVVIQKLFAIGMSLQHTALISSQAQVARRLESDLASLDQVISDLRSYIFDLRPTPGTGTDSA